jgi:hypothetical protein
MSIMAFSLTALEQFLPRSSHLLNTLIVLMPVAVFCLVIARINRRPYATVRSGVQDCGLLIFAFSGILFYLGPGLLTEFNFSVRDVWLINHYSFIKGMPEERGHQLWRVWWTLSCLAYALVVGGGLLLLLWKRRNSTAIYNVNTAQFEHVLGGVLDRLGLTWSRTGRQLDIRAKRLASAESNGVARNGSWAGLPNESARLVIEPWTLMSHVTLDWSPGSSELKTLIEDRLLQALQTVRRPERPNNGWMVAAAGLFLLLFALSVLYQVARWLEHRL